MAKRIIVVGTTNIELDDNDTKFNERNLNQFFERIAGRIDYIGQCHADAGREALRKEQEVEQAYIGRYKAYKEEGKSDKTAELYAKGDPIVKEKKAEHIDARHAKDTLYAHLSALNAARDDAHNLGHSLRAEMKHLNMDIYAPKETPSSIDRAVDDVISNIVKDSSSYVSG